MGNHGKERISVTVSPYLKKKLERFVGDGRPFSSASDAANIALTELFCKLEREEREEREIPKKTGDRK